MERMLGKLALLALMLSAASAGPNENKQVDETLQALIKNSPHISAPDHSMAFTKNTGNMITRFTIYFLSGTSQLEAAARNGDAQLENDDKTIRFGGTLNATLNYSFRLSSGQSNLILGKAIISWENTIEARISVDNCKVNLADFSLISKNFSVDIEALQEVIKSATIRPPVDNNFEKVLEPHLKNYVTKSFQDLAIC